MSRKSMTRALCTGFALLLVCTAFVAASAAAEAEKGSPGSVNGKFFQGVWYGEWTGYQDTTVRQEATVEVGPEIKEGVFEVKYSWGEAKYLIKTVPSGKTKTEGMMREDTFHFSWENKKGKKFEMTLKKIDDTSVKAKLDGRDHTSHIRSSKSGPGRSAMKLP